MFSIRHEHQNTGLYAVMMAAAGTGEAEEGKYFRVSSLIEHTDILASVFLFSFFKLLRRLTDGCSQHNVISWFTYNITMPFVGSYQDQFESYINFPGMEGEAACSQALNGFNPISVTKTRAILYCMQSGLFMSGNQSQAFISVPF